MDNSTRTLLFGTEMNTWGLYCAVGAAFALLAIVIVCRSQKMRKGSAALLGILCLLLGTAFSRVIFCLLNLLSGTVMTFRMWLRVSYGGWTMFGMIGGVMLAAVIGARLMKEKPAKTLDAVSVALPLMIAAERQGERSLDLFNVSRSFDGDPGLLSFLTVRDSLGSTRLAVFHVATAFAIGLFLIQAFIFARHKRKDGDLWIGFLILCGAGGVFVESLRYDQFLVYSFVQTEQVLAALMLLSGIILAVRRNRSPYRTMNRMTVAVLIISVLESIIIMFALDRTSASHIMLYSILFGTLAISAAYGMTALWRPEKNLFQLRTFRILMTAICLLEAAAFTGVLLETIRTTHADLLLYTLMAMILTIIGIHVAAAAVNRSRKA